MSIIEKIPDTQITKPVMSFHVSFNGSEKKPCIIIMAPITSTAKLAMYFVTFLSSNL